MKLIIILIMFIAVQDTTIKKPVKIDTTAASQMKNVASKLDSILFKLNKLKPDSTNRRKKD